MKKKNIITPYVAKMEIKRTSLSRWTIFIDGKPHRKFCNPETARKELDQLRAEEHAGNYHD